MRLAAAYFMQFSALNLVRLSRAPDLCPAAEPWRSQELARAQGGAVVAPAGGRAGDGAVPQYPPAGESQSNGAVENAVKLIKGMIRVHIIALERKLGVTIPVSRPIVARMVEAVSDMTPSA